MRNASAEHWIEKVGPLLLGLLFFGMNLLWWQYALKDTDVTKSLLDRVVQASSVFVGFWGIAITLLLGMNDNQLVRHLRSTGYYIAIVKYFGEGFLASLVMLALSIVLDPFATIISRLLLSSAWIGVAVWALLTTLRSYVIFTKLITK
jgi:hypothetical protein